MEMTRLVDSGGLFISCCLDAPANAILVWRLLDRAQQTMQGCIVENYGIGLQVVHLHHLAHKWVEDPHQAQSSFAGDDQLWFVPRYRERLPDDSSRSNR